MQKIIIKNFCAVEYLEMNLDNKIDVIIGPQASGKSTVAKIIYFCRKVRDYLIEYLTNSANFNSVHPNEYYSYFLKNVRQKFMGCFGTTKHMDNFNITFYYDIDSNCKMNLRLDESGYVRIYFSKQLSNNIKSLIVESSKLFLEQNSESDDNLYDKMIKELTYRSFVRKHINDAVNKMFFYGKEIIYIPAGRSILSTLSDKLPDYDTYTLDLPLKEFIELINVTKTRFGYSIKEIISNYTKTVDGQINNDNVNLSYTLIHEILKGDYVNENDGEKIYYNQNKWVKLKFASSGQQEILWILLVIFIRILENKSSFIVVEEPEAHLFPSAQKKVLELIMLLVNATNSQVLITTHSPYVLTSVNLLAYSGKVEKSKSTNKTIVNKKFRVTPNSLDAYMINSQPKFKFESIIDSNLGLINAEKIDEISNEINELIDKLMDMEISDGLQ